MKLFQILARMATSRHVLHVETKVLSSSPKGQKAICDASCYKTKIVHRRAPGDHDGMCHWWRYDTIIVDGERAWLRQHGGEKRLGIECNYKGMSQKRLAKQCDSGNQDSHKAHWGIAIDGLRWQEDIDPLEQASVSRLDDLLEDMRPNHTEVPIRLRMYLADCDAIGNKINISYWIDYTLQLFAHYFRGATIGPAHNGVWKNTNNGRLVFEKSYIVETLVSESNWKKYRARVERYAIRYGRETGQGEVMLEVGGWLIRYDIQMKERL